MDVQDDEAVIEPDKAKLPAGLVRANPDQAKPLIKMMGRLMSRRLRMPHGKLSPQDVKIGHKQKKWKNEMKYW